MSQSAEASNEASVAATPAEPEVKLSERAQLENYLSHYCLQECLDEALNEVLEKKPVNPYAALANFFEVKTMAEVMDVKLRCILIGRGGVGVEATVYTNSAPYVGRCPISRYGAATGGDALLDFSMVQGKAKEALRGMNPMDALAIDAAVLAVEKITPPVALAISMACCRAGAGHSQKTLYKYLADTAKLAECQPRLPAPCVTVLARSAGGSSAVNQALTIIPTTPSYVGSAIETCVQATTAVNRVLSESATACTVPDLGAPAALPPTTLTELVELVNQAFSEDGVEGHPKICIDYRGADLKVQTAADAAGGGDDDDAPTAPATYQPDGPDDGTDAEAANATVPMAAEGAPEPEPYVPLHPTLSGREVSDAIINMWRATSFIGIEDPVCCKDRTGLSAFADSMAEMISRVTTDKECKDLAYNFKGLAGNAECFMQITADRRADLNMIHPVFNTVKVGMLDGGGSVMAAMGRCAEVKRKNLTLVIGVNEGGSECADDFLTDFAVAVGAHQLQAGGLGAVEYACKYSRLVDISEVDESLRYVGKNYR